MIKFYKLLTLMMAFSTTLVVSSLAQTPCENGFAEGFPCNMVDLQSRLTKDDLMAEGIQGGYVCDIWGWTDEMTGKEYALVAMINGVSFVDISDPVNPVLIGRLPEHYEASGNKNSRGSGAGWRDVKAYKNHAYVVSEDVGHGMQVFDMTQLRDVANPPAIFSETNHYTDISNAHNIVINEDTGFAYAVGATRGKRCRGGGLHMINLEDPANPVYAGCYDDAGYTHDAQCVIYKGPDVEFRNQEVCFNSNTNKIVIASFHDKANPTTISEETYTNAFYTHQGWLSDDHSYFYSNDELDESNTGNNTRTFVWDVKTLRNPILKGFFTSAQRSIDHNLYIKGDYMYQSNYTSGLRVLNIKGKTPETMSEVAYFDTFNQNDAVSFNGSWSNYPFFESGNIILSDRQNGLFVVRLSTELNTEGGGEVTSIDDVNSPETFAIFPNPASKEININYLDLGPDPISLTLFDVNGKKVYSEQLPVVNYSGSKQLDVSFMKRGMYHVRLSNGSETVVRRIALQ